MDGLVTFIIIIGVLSKIFSAANKVKKNAPARNASPVKPAPPAWQLSTPAAPPVRTPAAPSPAADADDFWKKVSGMLEESKQPEKRPAAQKNEAADHAKAGTLTEGMSRECEHGAVGGSMVYESHEGGKRVERTKNAYERSPEDSLYRPAMTAQEMRRAVVMAEILKRPQERMAEQARRWTVR